MEERLRELSSYFLKFGLIEAADRVAKVALELRRNGSLPENMPNPLRHEIVIIERLDGKPGAIRLKHAQLLDIDMPYEIDQLGLEKKTRNALIRAGFSTFDDIRFALELELLSRVNNIGSSGVREVVHKFARYGLRGSGADS